MKTLEICLSPDLIHLFDLQDKAVVVVDILRATSCMVTGFAHGIEAIIPVSKVDECKDLQKQGLVCAAERDGMKVDGFDLDNSPFSYMSPTLKGKTIAVTTTNGTQAINKSKQAKQIIIGAFLNINAVAAYLRKSDYNILIVCAGWKGNVNLEDTLFAGALAHLLIPEYQLHQDAAIAAHHLYTSHADDMFSFVSKSQHVKRLANLNISKDISFCLNYDTYQVVPIYTNGKLTIRS